MLPKLRSTCKELGIELTSEQERQFWDFRQALYEVNVERNLTRVAIGDCELRHFAESCLIADMIPNDAKVLDLGTGPGFPAFPLAVIRPDIHVTAVDSNGKMIGFLQSQPLRNLVAILGRAEEMPDLREQFDIVTGRALAPLPIQLEVSAFACRIGGRVIPFRSAREKVQLPWVNQLGLKFVGTILRNVTPDEPDRAFPIYEKVRTTDPKYPRTWAMIKKRPLGT